MSATTPEGAGIHLGTCSRCGGSAPGFVCEPCARARLSERTEGAGEVALSDEEWAPIWQALRACRAWDDAPVPLLHQNDERHVRHTLTPALRAHVAAAVAEAGESGLRARLRAYLDEAEAGIDQWGTCRHEWLSLRELRALLDSPADDAADEGA